MKKFLADRDVFGPAITLTFNGSDRYKTVKGGFLTMLIYAAFMW